MKGLTAEEREVLIMVAEGNARGCGSGCGTREAMGTPNQLAIARVLRDRGLVVPLRCQITTDATHGQVTPRGRLALELDAMARREVDL